MAGMKGRIKPDHLPQNKYTLRVSGLPPIEFLMVDGLDIELETADMPDRTRVSGGNTKATEITVEHMHHHSVETAAMEKWFKDSQDPVAPGYKRDGVLVLKSITGLTAKTWQLKGAFPRKRVMSNLELKNEGDAVTLKWTLSVDDLKKLGA